jgi:hypothetical protein
LVALLVHLDLTRLGIHLRLRNRHKSISSIPEVTHSSVLALGKISLRLRMANLAFFKISLA